MFSSSIQLKNSYLLVLEKCLLLATSFLISILLARVGGKEIFGQYAYILSFVSLFSPLCIMGLNNIATKYVVKRPENSHFYIKAILYVRGSGAILSIAIGYIFVNTSNTAASFEKEIIALLAFQAFQFLYVFEFYFLAKNHILPSLLIRLSAFLITTILKFIVVWFDLGILLLIVAHGLNYLLTALGYLTRYYWNKAHLAQKRAPNINTSFTLFHQGKWLLLAGFAALIYLKIDQIMLAHLYDMETVAVYAAAAKLSEFWYVFPVLVANAYYPKLIKKHQRNSTAFDAFIKKLLSFFFAFALLLSITTVFIANWLVTLLYGDAFLLSGSILSIHIFATCFIFQRAFYSKWLISNNLFKYSLYSQGLGAGCNILLNALLIPSFGGIGAAWATVFSYAVASYFSLFISKNSRPFANIMTGVMLTWPWVIHQWFVNQSSSKHKS